MALIEGSADELVALVAGLSSVRMDDYAVVGSYMRFGERVREPLKDARVRIAEVWQLCGACDSPGMDAVGFAPTPVTGDALGPSAATQALRTSAIDATTTGDRPRSFGTLMGTSP
jgi:hypothetical protein